MTLLLPARIPMRFASLFAGIGGFDLGFERAGMECVAQVEWDEKARSVLEKRFPNARMYKDVRDVGRDELGSVDLVCGGFPCQDVSVAGKRKGLAGERSGLWFEFRRILDEVRPRWVVIENVPGLLSSNGGRDFAVVLHGLVELRYRVAWRVLDAQYFGVAQRRRRVFLVGYLGDGRAAEVLFERDGRAWDSPPSRATGQGAAADAEDGAGTGGTGWDGQGMRIHDSKNPAPSLRSHRLGGQGVPYVAASIPAQTERLRGFGDYEQGGVASSLQARDYKYATDLIAAPLADSGAGTARTGNERTEAQQLVVVGATETAKTITQNYGKQPDNSDSSTPGNFAIAYGLATSVTPKFALDLSPTLTQPSPTGGGQPPAIAFTQNSREEVRQINRDGQIAGALGADEGMHQRTYMATPYAVRRLTPVECERLQGFPDGWTGGQADTTRYKQLGNAVCVNVSAWLGQRIVAADRSP